MSEAKGKTKQLAGGAWGQGSKGGGKLNSLGHLLLRNS
ncbi:hypothetical protein SynRS9909_02097 [Synechococcus sp. RS9909]|nr:hypothetical protein SynRS9909_02097 [Synechococcus sp. RS9909]